MGARLLPTLAFGNDESPCELRFSTAHSRGARARCFVEADEARHFTMFRRLLETLRAEEGTHVRESVRVTVKRLVALDDEQILYASWCVRGAANVGPFVRAEESKRHRAMIWKLYRPEHARFVATLTLQTLGLSLSPARLSWISALLHGVGSRGDRPLSALCGMWPVL